MKGRLEHELRTENNIKKILEVTPSYVSDYYYNIQISKEPMTCLEYLRKIKLFLDFINCDINKVDDITVGRYFKKISKKVDKDGIISETSSSYLKTTWTTLNRFFIYLQRKNIIKENPLSNTERPKNTDNVRRIFLDMADLNNILNTVKTGAGNKRAIGKQRDWKERDLLIMFLFMNTGIRRTALSEINISDIIFNEKELVVTDKRKKILIYNITNEMEQVIRLWLNKREKLLAGKKSDALFISSRRERMSEKSIYNLVRKYSEEALGYAISPHKLRAAFVSLYYEASGGDIKATCEAVGHADISTTSIYITRRNNSRKEAQNFMSKSLKI